MTRLWTSFAVSVLLMNESKLEKYLDENGELTYSNVGVSMLPLLRQGKDLFTVRKKNAERCKKYDVVLYRRPPDKHVLHRVIQVRENDYVILGDNCIKKEYGITDGDIIGVMTGYVRNGKTHSVDDFGFKLYSRVWCAIAPVRIGLKKLKIKVRKLLR